MKTHLRHRTDARPVCNVLKGYYEPLKLTSSPSAVTCRRCVKHARENSTPVVAFAAAEKSEGV
jgi:hypothetical protein